MTPFRPTRPGPLAAFGAAALLLMADPADLSAQSVYRRPPKAVSDVLDAPAPPAALLSPTRDQLLLVQSDRYPAIADLAEPMLRLAGVRINPKTNGPAREPRVKAVSVLPVAGGEPKAVTLPQAKMSAPEWSPDGKRFALTATAPNGVRLCTYYANTGTMEAGYAAPLNAALGDSVRWLSDSSGLLIRLIPGGRGTPPPPPVAPAGPTVQESRGKAAPVRTYQDLLQNAHDEDLFDYYCTSQLAFVDDGGTTPVGKPGVFAGAVPSPDGKYLLVTRLHRPYSYLYPASSFPKTIEVWDRAGTVVRTVADLPLQDNVPIEGVPTGPRAVAWHPTADATLVWVEARDGGDPKVKVPHRDEVMVLGPPFTDAPAPQFKTEHRFSGLSYFPDGDRVLASDFDRDRRWTRTVLRTLSRPADAAKVIFDRSSQDRYHDPGVPLTRRLPNGRVALWAVNDTLFLAGTGATAKGEVPFLDRLDVATGAKERLSQSGPGVYETAVPLSDDGKKLLVRRESPTDPGNLFLRDSGKGTPLTHNTDPFPELRKVKKQLVTTKRPDGVTISFTLYLPPDLEPGERRPTVFYAYPREFNTADTAGQVSGSPNRFTSIGGYSHLFFLTQGYVVMDEVSVPIVGPPDGANDTFVQQLTADAKAAVDKAVEMGAVDPDRIGVLGHSYGAFMTANLLAHTDLFRAGIARSGAYNRTLTPFGFQNERRTFWEAPGVYAAMSPFNAADKIKEPILFIHGAADDNPGTFPVQSERMYQAVRGTGGTARLVLLLPHEAHGYAARESVEHVLAEQIDWFDKYVKNASPRTPPGQPSR